MKLLHVDSSALGAGSVTRELSAAIVARWADKHPRLQVEYRDLDADPLPHLTQRSLAGDDNADAAESGRVMERFLAADAVVIGAPMYNVQLLHTFEAQGVDRSHRGGRKVIIASGRGGLHTGSPTDFQEAYLRQVFGFPGIADIAFVRAEGVAHSLRHRAEAVAGALAAIPEPLPVAA